MFSKSILDSGEVVYKPQYSMDTYTFCDMNMWIDCKNRVGKFSNNRYHPYSLEVSDGNPIIVEEVARENGDVIDTSQEYYICGKFEKTLASLSKHEVQNGFWVPTVQYRKIHDDVSSFLDKKELYQGIGIPYKRGYFLYGRPEDGKTTIIIKLIQEFFLGNALVMHVEDFPDRSFLKALSYYKDLLKIFIFEDFQSHMTDNSVPQILNFLDGRSSLDNCIFFATTNYPEKIPGNIIDRPSRFDFIVQIDDPSSDDIAAFVKQLTGKESDAHVVSALHGFSMAALKEILLIHMMYGNSIFESIDVLRSRAGLASTGFKKEDARDFIL